MYRSFITTIAAASVALTTLGAAPAFADRDNDLAHALAAIAGIAVVGALIHENKKKRKKVRHDQRYDPQNTPRVHRPHRLHVQPHVDPRPLPRHVRRNLLPQNCLRDFRTRHGKVRMFPRRCLERNYSFINRLPDHCATRIKTDHGRRVGWEAHCLRQAGYRLARR